MHLPPWTLRHTTLHFQPYKPLLMGIVNVTPDSFSDGGQFFEAEAAIEHGLSLVQQGAQILDIGGESTRPGSRFVEAAEEIQRVVPVIEGLAARCGCPLSIDTTKAAVAQAALEAGAEIVNDVSCMRFDPQLPGVVAMRQAHLILMHSRHTPADMQRKPHYHDLWSELRQELHRGLDIALDAGVPRERIALDPGIGFAKRLQDNLQILRELQELQSFGLPILIGASRKSFLGALLGTPTEQRLEGSLAAAATATFHGAHILRVHDVAQTQRLIQVLSAILNPSS